MSASPASRVAASPAWDRYWSSPRLAACLRDGEGNYGGAIGQSWKHWFGKLTPGAELLDLATGNGAVALLALDHSDREALGWGITAVDAADIDPPAALPELADRLCRIRFLGQVPCETLPFGDARFDAVTGQYALEYTDMERSLGEAARVLRDGGLLAFITHRRDSTVMEETRSQLEIAHRLSDLGLPAGVRRLLAAAEGSDEHAAAEAAFARIAAEALDQFRSSRGQSKTFIGQYLKRLGEIYEARHGVPPDESERALDDLGHDLDAHIARLQALSDAALGPSRLQRTLDMLAAGPFGQVDSSAVLDDAGRPLGHRFEAVRCKR